MLNSLGHILLAVEKYWEKSGLWGFGKMNEFEGRKTWRTCSQVKNEAETLEITKEELLAPSSRLRTLRLREVK